MAYKIYIVDRDTEKPVTKATIVFKTKAGTVLHSYQTQTGAIEIDADDTGLLDSGNMIEVSASSYYTWIGDTGFFNAYSSFTVLLRSKPSIIKYLAIGAVVGAGIGFSVGRPGKGKKVVKGFNDMPPAAQTAIVFAGIGLVGLGVWWFLKDRDQSDETPATAKQELERLADRGIFPTMSAGKAATMKSALVAAFNNAGTDEDQVFQVMGQLRNEADVYQLIVVYDVQSYASHVPGMSDRGNLIESLYNELSADDIGVINNILRSNGVNYQF